MSWIPKRIPGSERLERFEKTGGEGKTAEAGATFIGGLPRFMHKDRRERTIKGTGGGW